MLPANMAVTAAQAMMKRPPVPSPVTRDQTFRTPLRRVPESVAEAKAPDAMPKTNATCH
jgi:hypothetical protein